MGTMSWQTLSCLWYLIMKEINEGKLQFGQCVLKVRVTYMCFSFVTAAVVLIVCYS